MMILAWLPSLEVVVVHRKEKAQNVAKVDVIDSYRNLGQLPIHLRYTLAALVKFSSFP
jgi:hypothetical protein